MAGSGNASLRTSTVTPVIFLESIPPMLAHGIGSSVGSAVVHYDQQLCKDNPSGP